MARRPRKPGSHTTGGAKRRKQPSSLDRRAWRLVGLRKNVKLVYTDDHVSILAPGIAPILVFADHVILERPTQAEKARLRQVDPKLPLALGGIHLPAGHRLEKELVSRRLDAVPKKAVTPRRPGKESYEASVLEARERERLRKLRYKGAAEGLLTAAPILRAAGIDIGGDARSIVVRGGIFHLEEQRSDGAIELNSRYAPAMRFAGFDTVFEKPNKTELAAIRPPATRKGREVHAPVGSDAWRTLIELRAKRAVRALAVAQAERLSEIAAQQQRVAQEQQKREREQQRAKALAPKLAAQLAQQLTDDKDAFVFEEGRIYLNNVPAGDLVLDPAPHIELYEEPPLTISGTAVVPDGLSPVERKWVRTAEETERPGVLTRIIRERLRSSRRHVLAEIGEARKLLIELGASPEQTREGLCVAGQLEVPFGDSVPLEQLKARYGGALLAASIEKHLGSRIRGLAVAQDGPSSVVVSAGERVIGEVDAFAAVIGQGDQRAVVQGKFLNPGGHWSKLSSQIARAFPDVVIDPSGDALSAMQVIDEVPDGIPPALAERCLEASRAIRTRRNAAFANPVKLSTAGRTTVTFFPVQDDGEPFVPITHERGESKVRCHLRLGGVTDPLPLAIRGHVDDPAGVWALSLLGFETLTVIPEPEHKPVSRRSPGQRPRGAAISRNPGSHRLPSRGGRMRYISGDLEPTGITRTAHWVVGHIRLLTAGQEHSEAAAHEASKQGITLRPSETWVRPHVRGLSSSEPLTFRWQLPHEALSLVP